MTVGEIVGLGKQTGKFHRLSTASKGFVFIKGDNARDYFCHATALKGGLTIDTVQPEQAVSFVGHASEKGLRAEEVYPGSEGQS